MGVFHRFWQFCTIHDSLGVVNLEIFRFSVDNDDDKDREVFAVLMMVRILCNAQTVWSGNFCADKQQTMTDGWSEHERQCLFWVGTTISTWPFTYLCLPICAHKQKAHGQQSGCSQFTTGIMKNAQFVALVNQCWVIWSLQRPVFRRFLLIHCADSLCLQHAQMPRCGDLVIFVPIDDRWQQTTKLIVLPLVHVSRVNYLDQHMNSESYKVVSEKASEHICTQTFLGHASNCWPHSSDRCLLM